MIKTGAIRLNIFGLPLIQNLEEFSDLTHLSKYTLYQLSKHSDKYYRTYTVPKRNGKLRTISQPSKRLKGLQSWILVNILNKIQVSSSCKGFEKGSSIADNAYPHIGANALLTIDLEDFFPTIQGKQVYNIFKTIGYNKLIATIFTKLCTYKNALPQGGPCSPKLANLSAWKLDVRIQGYVGKRGINYTRYADDMSFSSLSPHRLVRIIPLIKEVIKDENFKVNHSKTRIAGISRSKKVTGLVLSDSSFGIGKHTYKGLRAKVHHLILPKEQSNLKLLSEVQGWISYLGSVDLNRKQRILSFVDKLSKAYPKTLITRVIVK